MPPARRSPTDGGCPFAYAPSELAGPICWEPGLVPITVVLTAVPDNFPGARPVDPARLEPLLADLDSPDGRHVILADAEGEHRLWIRNAAPGQPLAALVPLDADFQTRIDSLLRFHRRLFGKRAGPQPRSWPLTTYRRKRLDRMRLALDMRRAGASYRKIAVALGHKQAARLPATEWKISAERSQIVRLVRDAAALANGGHVRLLRIRP